MARQATVTINDEEYTLQSVSPGWYLEQNDRYGMTGDGRRDTAGYMDVMFKNVVISPSEVAAHGMAYFNHREDIETPEKLMREIEKFFRPGKKSKPGVSPGISE